MHHTNSIGAAKSSPCLTGVANDESMSKRPRKSLYTAGKEAFYEYGAKSIQHQSPVVSLQAASWRNVWALTCYQTSSLPLPPPSSITWNKATLCSWAGNRRSGRPGVALDMRQTLCGISNYGLFCRWLSGVDISHITYNAKH